MKADDVEDSREWCTHVLGSAGMPLPAPSAAKPRRNTAAFVIYLERLEDVTLPSIYEDLDVSATVRVSFFFDGSKQVFGKTWVSEPCKVVPVAGKRRKVDVEIKQHAWFKTKIEDEDCLGIVELVFHAPSFNDSVDDLEVPLLPHQVAAGWQLVSMFPPRGERHTAETMDDIPQQISASIDRLDMLPGSPQVLFVLEVHAIEGLQSLQLQTEMQGALSLALIEATAPLSKRFKYVPDNMLVSRYTRVPGLVENLRPMFDDEEDPETWEWIRDAAPEQAKPLIASDLQIAMTPSLQRFEETLLDHIKQSVTTAHPGLDEKETSNIMRRVAVKQRFLNVGVHNGLTYLKKPTQIPLVQESGNRSYASTREGEQGSDENTRAAEAQASSGDGGSHLHFDGTIELRDVVQAPEMAVTLELLYAVAVPVVFDKAAGKQGKRMSRAFSHQQSISALPTQMEQTFCLRFGCVLPFAGGQDPAAVASHTIELLGPPLQTPKNDLLFTAQQLDRDSRVFLTKQYCQAFASLTLSVTDVDELLHTRGENLGHSMRHAMVRALSHVGRDDEDGIAQRPQSAEPSPRMRGRRLPSSPAARSQSLYVPKKKRGQSLLAPPGSHRKPQPSSTTAAQHSGGGRSRVLAEKQRAVSFSTNLAAPVRRGGPAFATPLRPSTAPDTSTGKKGGEEGLLPSRVDRAVHEFPAGDDVDDHDMREVNTTIQPDEVTVAQLPFAQHALLPGDAEPAAEFPGVSRALQAEIMQAAFRPVVTDDDLREMKVPAALLPLPPGPGVLRKDIELQDAFAASRVTLQFLALEWLLPDHTRQHLPGVLPRHPAQSIAVSFKLHKLPTFVSMPLRFSTASSAPGMTRTEDTRTAGVLFAVEGNNALASSPGLLAAFSLDPAQLGVSQEQLLEYSGDAALEIHVVDADSLMPVGVASMKLSCFLRGGYRGVQSSLELDVVNTHADPDRINFAHPRARTAAVSAPQTVAKLCVRVSSIGQTSRPPPNVNRLLIPKAALPDSALINPMSGQTSHHRAQPAAKLIADDPRARAVLHREVSDPEQERKAARLRAIRAKRRDLFNDQNTPGVSGSAKPQPTQVPLPLRSPAVNVRDSSDLLALNEYRLRQKRAVIQHALERSLRTSVDIFAAYGSKVYMEYRIQNPSHDQCLRVLVQSSSQHLQAVTNHHEWKALLQSRGLDRPVEPNMFNPTRDGPLVMLRPLEELVVPLKYSLPHTALPPVTLRGPSSHQVPASTRHTPPIHEKLKFESLDGVDFGSADVVVHPQEPAVDHHIDLYSAQSTIFRHRLRLPPHLAEVTGVLCSDPDVLVHLDHQDGVNDIVLKCSSGASPDVSVFLLLLYTDDFFVSPFMTWRVAVHAVDSYTMTVHLGEVATSTLTFRPSQPISHARVFSANESELEVLPKTQFSLAGNALAEIGMRAHPTAIGSSKHLVHVVDTEFKRIVYSYQVVLDVQPPPVSKTFEIVLEGAHEHVNKRIGYTNRFKRPVEISLYTSHPQRIQFKHHRFVLQPEEKTYIGIRAHASQTHLEEEAFVLLVDQQMRLHDSFKLRLITIAPHQQ
ncbi:hypothetical protein PTSG_11638 [Salpingoeca rosetta]|uniref:Nephrocystin-4 n=1 Tax=Salpingoeca rosetta (strain ATCC 50818 / BSB-021) TaxID=946362 RepID=F2TXD7_SALR5|nr:uncharacterized protein PTSG_11638 [Salpingoeca rosetta]EGD76046.1 hypothetical protein PTSG_11638 [Salpingoeca rosetta]|eukprot:XP_004998221.1 hypothetical protein PTSG_11638 [Salpingoeca rosetta]